MPIKDADPVRYQRFLDFGEDEKTNKWSLLELGDRLFPQESEFVKLCISGGGDRAQKINKLMEFETALLFVARLNMNRHGEMYIIEMKCSSFPSVFVTTKSLYHLLHKNLKELCEESGVPLPIQKNHSIDDALDRINRLLSDADLDDEPTSDYEPYPLLLREIKFTGIQYAATRAEDAAREIIDKIIKIEQDDYEDDKLVSKIEQQIKLVETLPYREVELELEELVKIYKATNSDQLFSNVEQLVNDTCAAMRKYKESGCNDLDGTLDLLIAKADSFEEEWEREYSRFFTSDDRPDPKRQRIE